MNLFFTKSPPIAHPIDKVNRHRDILDCIWKQLPCGRFESLNLADGSHSYMRTWWRRSRWSSSIKILF